LDRIGEGKNVVEAQHRKVDAWGIATAICLSLVAVLALVDGGIALIYGSGRVTTANRDFYEYWSAATLTVRGENPYGAADILQLERSAGANNTVPFITYSPPTILWLVVPMGYIKAKDAALVWLTFLLASLAASIWMLWVLGGRPRGGLYLLSLCYLPALYCIATGQIGIFLLLGVTLFLRFHESRPFVAGAALLLCQMKPHLFLPLALVLLLWIVHRKSYRILFGFALVLVTVNAIALLFDSRVWLQWEQMLQISKPTAVVVPTMSRQFRDLVDAKAAWLQFVPALVASVWAGWYFWTRRTRWSWLDHGLLLLMVSVACAPYAWITDESVLLPAILIGAQRARASPQSLCLFALIAGAELLEHLKGIGMVGAYYLWTVPAWFAWYLYSTRGWRSAASSSLHQAALERD
jgi:hypothetical protein